jgi:hypothetical protein
MSANKLGYERTDSKAPEECCGRDVQDFDQVRGGSRDSRSSIGQEHHPQNQTR